MKFLINFSKIILLIFLSANYAYGVNLEKAVTNISEFGFKTEMPFCKQSGSTIICDFIVENMSGKDEIFVIGLNHVLINHVGAEHKTKRIFLDGDRITPSSNDVFLIPKIPRTFSIEFPNVKGRGQYIPRVFISWNSKKCFSRFSACPDIKFSDVLNK